MSIGKLTPAMTSILARSMTEMARFDGVPPNMSVSKTAPSPVSTAAIERRMSWRRFSMSSSGPMHTAWICACGPTTCSSAATNSAASRPWVTKTMPIIDSLCWNDRCRSARGGKRARRDQGGGAGWNKIAVRQLHPQPGGAELRREPLRHVNGAMAAAGAADGDRQIGLAFLFVAREQRLQKPPQPGEKGRKVRIPLDMRGNSKMAPGQLPQFGDIMRVAEETHVEDQIGISRYAVAIRERCDEKAKTTGRQGKMAGQQPFQIGGAQVGGINHQISTVAQGRDHSAFEPDTVRHGPVAG